MKYEILPNGNLKISLELDDDRDEIRDRAETDQWESLFEDMGLLGNGWVCVAPEWIGALTDAPIVADGFEIDDDDKYVVTGRVWWFPNYCVENLLVTLAERGSVVFTRALSKGEAP